jgi:hypothetical protein
MKSSNDTTENQTRNLPTCSAVPQPTAPPRTPLSEQYVNSILVAVYCSYMPIQVVARSKAWVCGHWLAGIGGSIPVGGMGVCLL